MPKKLTEVQEKELIEEYLDGWSVHELTIIYRVNESTVYRTLAAYGAPKYNKRSRKKRVPRKKTATKPKELQPCGTNAAYQRHRKAGEYPCAPCLEAHAANVAIYRKE